MRPLAVREEDAIQRNICRFLDAALPADSYYCAIPNGSVLAGNPKQRGMQMNKLKSTGLKNGAPDLFIVARGQFIALEVKTSTGRLSETQKDTSDKIIAAGGSWAVVRSTGDVERFLKECGVVLHATVLM